MLFHLLTPLAEQFTPFNLFRYITFRSGGAVGSALLISFIAGPRVIAWLKPQQAEGQPIRVDGPESYFIGKKGSPTMGGFLILLARTSSTGLGAGLADGYVWVVIFVTVSFGGIGFVDDYKKLTKRSSSGLSARTKLAAEIIVATTAAILVMHLTRDPLASTLAVPFFKNLLIPFGSFFIALNVLVMIGSSNPVNFTDGLDGLAIVPAMLAAATFAIIAYLAGNAIFSNYLQLNHVPGAGELTLFFGAMVGAGLGFLWFNAPPAMVFMGDTGSLSIGGALGAISVITKHEILLALLPGLFLLETASLI